MPATFNTINIALQNYLDNQEALCIQYPDAYIILYDTLILGPFKTITEAYRVAFAQYELGSFVVIYCRKPEDIDKQI